MVKRTLSSVTALCVVAGVAAAEDLTGEDRILCAPGYVTHCSSGGDCETVPVGRIGLPHFLHIELDRKVIRSSDVNEDDLATPVQTMARENGKVYLQGIENERAFSILIDEATGDGSMAIIADGETATAFLYCTAD
jgi:hypothetical protein